MRGARDDGPGVIRAGAHEVKPCCKCLHFKTRTHDSGTCWCPDVPWHGATLSVADTCDQWTAKVIKVEPVK